MEGMTSVPKAHMLGKGNYEYAIPFYGEARPMLPDFIIQEKRDVGHLYDLFESGEDTLIAEAYAPGFNGGVGAHFWAKASVIRDDAGRVIGAIEAIRDISARKREEEEMLRKNAELSVLNEKLGALYGDLAEKEEELRQNYDEIVKGERALRETTQYPGEPDRVCERPDHRVGPGVPDHQVQPRIRAAYGKNHAYHDRETARPALSGSKP